MTKVAELPERSGYSVSFGPVPPELEAWLEEHHDPKWVMGRRYKRDAKGRFTR